MQWWGWGWGFVEVGVGDSFGDWKAVGNADGYKTSLMLEATAVT